MSHEVNIHYLIFTVINKIRWQVSPSVQLSAAVLPQNTFFLSFLQTRHFLCGDPWNWKHWTLRFGSSEAGWSECRGIDFDGRPFGNHRLWSRSFENKHWGRWIRSTSQRISFLQPGGHSFCDDGVETVRWKQGSQRTNLRPQFLSNIKVQRVWFVILKESPGLCFVWDLASGHSMETRRWIASLRINYCWRLGILLFIRRWSQQLMFNSLDHSIGCIV